MRSAAMAIPNCHFRQCFEFDAGRTCFGMYWYNNARLSSSDVSITNIEISPVVNGK
jgi:hypothetical protein